MLDEYEKVAAQLVALKSVSADPSCKEDIKKTAEFLKELLASYGFDVKLIDGYGNPFVLGSYMVNPKLETCLIYGHYDVQPADKEDGWDSDPFTLTEKNGRYYGRGIMDDKCQFLIHVLTIGKLIKEKKLNYNIKFLFEGEEELGSPHIEQFVKDYTKELVCDFVMLSDGEMITDKPTLELGNRGIVNMTVTIKTSDLDLHSGIYGGASPNANHELAKLIAGLFDKNNRLTIPGFYDDVEGIEEGYKIPFDLEEYKNNTGTRALLTEPEYDFFTQTGLRPSLTVTGMYGGYIKEGHKTTIPPQATAKLNFRIVKNQNPKKLGELIKKHIQSVVPDYVRCEITIDELADAQKSQANNKFVKKADDVAQEIWHEAVYYKYVGGTEPVLLQLQNYLNAPIVSIALASEDGHMHGINENFKIENIKNGFAFSEKFFGE